jgi:hypothetical protein
MDKSLIKDKTNLDAYQLYFNDDINDTLYQPNLDISPLEKYNMFRKYNVNQVVFMEK